MELEWCWSLLMIEICMKKKQRPPFLKMTVAVLSGSKRYISGHFWSWVLYDDEQFILLPSSFMTLSDILWHPDLLKFKKGWPKIVCIKYIANVQKCKIKVYKKIILEIFVSVCIYGIFTFVLNLHSTFVNN